MHDLQQIPTLIKDTVTDLANNVSIGPILCRSKVAGPDVMAEASRARRMMLLVSQATSALAIEATLHQSRRGQLAVVGAIWTAIACAAGHARGGGPDPVAQGALAGCAGASNAHQIDQPERFIVGPCI